MALPYYLPPTIPFGNCFAPTSVQQINQVYQQHNIHTMAFMQGVQYPPPHVGYNFAPVPFKPYYTAPVNSLKNLNFSHTAPKILYPIAPVPLRPMISPSSSQSYQFQLRRLAKRVATSDAQVNAEAKRHKPCEAPPSVNSLGLISDDNDSRVAKNPMLLVGQNPAIGNDVSLNLDPTYRQQLLLKPGPGQQYISKIRALVEGVSEDLRRQIASPKYPTKEKKVCQKSKTHEKLSTNKRTNPKMNKTESRIVPNNWHPDPESYANDHLVIGSNGTFISKSFYNTIPWKSFNKSTRILIGHYFNNYTLATQTLGGDNPLNPGIIEDIINHVMERCMVGRDSVSDIISSICADEASRRRRT